jgi:hypothetical protein
VLCCAKVWRIISSLPCRVPETMSRALFIDIQRMPQLSLMIAFRDTSDLSMVHVLNRI